jgi:hypothetical protein
MGATLDSRVESTGAVFEAKFMLPWSFSEEAAAERATPTTIAACDASAGGLCQSQSANVPPLPSHHGGLFWFFTLTTR